MAGRLFIMFLLLAMVGLAGCTYCVPGTYNHHVKIDPIRIEPIYIKADITIRHEQVLVEPDDQP